MRIASNLEGFTAVIIYIDVDVNFSRAFFSPFFCCFLD